MHEIEQQHLDRDECDDRQAERNDGRQPRGERNCRAARQRREDKHEQDENAGVRVIEKRERADTPDEAGEYVRTRGGI